MNKTVSSTILASILCACLSSLTAELIVYEGFDYSTPNILGGLNGGAGGWDSAWVDRNSPDGQTFDVTGTGLNYTGLVTTGGAVLEDQQNDSIINSSSYRRTYDLGTSGFGSDGTEGWVSYLVDVTGSGSHGFQWGPSGGNLTQLQIYRINEAGSSNTWRLQIGGNTDSLVDADGISATGSFLILMKVDYQSGADPTSVWINPNIASEATLGTPDLFLDTNGVGANDTMTFYAGNFPTSVAYDEIRVATTFDDAISAIPEPSTYALIAGFLAFGSIMLRRRN